MIQNKFKSKFKQGAALACMLLIGGSSFATIRAWNGSTTNYALLSAWTPNGVPSTTDVLTVGTVATGKYPQINGSVNCASITLSGNATIDFTSASGVLNVYGNLTNNTTNQFAFDGLMGTVAFRGALNSTIASTNATTSYFYKLAVNKTASTYKAVIANGTTVVVRHNLKLQTGNIDAKLGHANLVMDAIDNAGAWQTAFIDGAGTGNVEGAIDVRQYVRSSIKTYHFMSSPTLDSSKTYSSTSILEPYTNQTDLYNSSYTYSAPGVTIPDFIYYNETLQDPVNSGSAADSRYGWVGLNPVTSANNRVAQAQCFSARFSPYTSGATPFNVKYTGIVNNGNISVPVSFTNNSELYDGTNLFGNPYPSAIDWNVVAGDNPDYPVAYVWVTDGTEFGGSNYIIDAANPTNNTMGATESRIAMGEGFRIWATAATAPTFYFNNAQRIASETTPFYRTATTAAVDIKLGGANNHDLTLVHFGDYNTTDKLPIKNVRKMMNYENSLYTLSGSEFITSLNLAYPTSETQVPLGISIAENGNYYFEDVKVNLPADNYIVFLEDKKDKKTIEVTEGFHYDFSSEKGTDNQRFVLRVINKNTVTGNNIPAGNEYAVAANNEIVFQLSDFGNQTLVASLVDANGRMVWQGNINTKAGRGVINDNTLPKGLLFLNITNNSKNTHFKIVNTN